MSDAIKTGTGLTYHVFDYENEEIEIDFSGVREDQCYRNDASVFFFAASSYRNATFVIDKKIRDSFKNKNRKDIEHLILPYFFNFRQYLELEFKAIHMAISNKPATFTHKLLPLITDTEALINSYSYKDTMFTQNVKEEISKAKAIIISIKEKVETLFMDEPADEYYRFLYGKNKAGISLVKPILRLDFKSVSAQFQDINKLINSLILSLREAGVYVYVL